MIIFYYFENRKGIFPDVQGNIKFCLLTIGNGSQIFTVGAQMDDPIQIKDCSRVYNLTIEDIEFMNPNTLTCPTFKNREDARIVLEIHKKHAFLIKEGLSQENPWQVKLITMFHMTNDSKLFHVVEELNTNNYRREGNIFVKEKEKFLPLYESKLTYQYDHRAATFSGIPSLQRFKIHAGTNTPNAIDKDNPKYLSEPRFWISLNEVVNKMGANQYWFIGFRNAISAVADSRSLIACIVPFYGVGNSMPIVTSDKSPVEQCSLLATLNSFVLDYVLRQKASGGNLNFYILKQLPIPTPLLFAKKSLFISTTPIDWIFRRVLELVYTAWDLAPFACDCSYDGPPFRWDEERRFFIRCEIDAAYFHLYGIKREDVDYIMETFPIVKRKDEEAFGTYRTKETILDIYDQMQAAIDTGVPYKTPLNPPPGPPKVWPIPHKQPWPEHIHKLKC